jgi:hypothetical protein
VRSHEAAFGRFQGDVRFGSLADMATIRARKRTFDTAGIEANICLRVYESTPQVRPKK